MLAGLNFISIFFVAKHDNWSACWIRNRQRRICGQQTGCSAQTVTRIGLLEEIPRSGVQIPCLYLMGRLGGRAPYATRRKLRYEANQVWMNTTFISQGPQSSGI